MEVNWLYGLDLVLDILVAGDPDVVLMIGTHASQGECISNNSGRQGSFCRCWWHGN